MGFTMPSDTSVGNFVDKPGQFHFAVSHIEDGPAFNGKIADAVVVDATVLDGTDKTQVKKTIKLFLNNPNLSHRDGGNFCAKVQARMAIALELIDPKTPAGQEVEIDWSKGIGRQFKAKLTTGEDAKGKPRIDLDGAYVYHVDDPEAAHIPADAKALALIGKKPQAVPGATTAATPAKRETKAAKQQAAATPANGNGNGSHAVTEATATTPVKQAVDVSDL